MTSEVSSDGEHDDADSRNDEISYDSESAEAESIAHGHKRQPSTNLSSAAMKHKQPSAASSHRNQADLDSNS